MARGQQKIQAQEKNAKKLADKKKQAAGSTQKDAATKALHYKCPVCLTGLQSLATFKQHFESKHPSAPLPDELKA